MYLDVFLNYLRYERNYSDNTILAYRRDIEQFYSYSCLADGEDVLGVLNVCNARSWLMELMNNQYSATSVRRKLSSLRVYSRFLFKNGFISKDELGVLVSPKMAKKLPVFVRSNDMERLLNGDTFSNDFEGCRDRLIIDMFYSTGIRLAELVGLNNDDVDLESRTIKVLGKGNKERLIPFGFTLRGEIEAYFDLRGALDKIESGVFFVKLDGKRVTRSLVYKLVRGRLSEVSTVVKKSPHVLRHSFATNMLNNGADLQVIKEILGHSSLAATEIYTHTTFKELKKIYKQAHPRA